MEIEDIYPLSDIEKGMIFHSLVDSNVYHSQIAFQLKIPEFDSRRFDRSFQLMMEKHPILRTGFNMYQYQEPVQMVFQTIEPDIRHFDLSRLSKEEQETAVLEAKARDKAVPFDVENPRPLWRMRTFTLGNHYVFFLWIAHHAIIDGWSTASLMTELSNIYAALGTDPHFKPQPLKSTYKDFVVQQVIQKRKPENIEFWKKELAGSKRLTFPAPPSAPNANEASDHEGPATINRNLDHLRRPLDTTAQQTNIPLKHLCFAAYVFMLQMVTYDDDIVVGLVVNNRPLCEDGDKLIGCFLNTVPVRVTLPYLATWMDFARYIDDKLLQLKRYDRVSLFEIARQVGEDSQGANPFFDVMFNYVDFHIYDQLSSNQLGSDPWKKDSHYLSIESEGVTNASFDFIINAGSNGLSIELNYDVREIDHHWAETLCHYFQALLEQLVSNPGGPVKKQPLMTDDQRKMLLETFNNTAMDYPAEKTLHHMFRDQADQNPDGIAVTLPSRRSVTYRQLDERSSFIAGYLQVEGVTPGAIVGVLMERTLDMAAALLGILKTGAAYLPLDPTYPTQRIQYILNHSRAAILLTQTGLPIPRATHSQVVYIDEMETAVPYHRVHAIDSTLPAYVIYTSGSTGKPKGVLIPHRAVGNFIAGMTAVIPFSPDQRILSLTTVSFDIFVLEFWLPLVIGARVVLGGSEEQLDAAAAAAVIRELGITIFQLTPSRLHMFLEVPEAARSLSLLECLLIGGEPLPAPLLEKTRQYVTRNIFNLYGPTETTVWSTVKDISHNKALNIGTPIANTQIHILSKTGLLQPPGVAGELCISGHGIATGYLNNPQLTAEKFTINNWSHSSYPSHLSHPSHPSYHTGDLARWLPDGNIQFIGRIDNQVKIRGYRIELGEIETCLLQHPHIEEAAVTATQDHTVVKHLCAYYVPVTATTPDRTQLREHLNRHLPEYMVPSYFQQLETMPLTPNGKIDRQSLPTIETTTSETNTSETTPPPQTPIEITLATLWADVLDTHPDSIGIDSNFFRIGGHSLRATILASRIRQEMDVQFPLGILFNKPTIREFAQYLDQTEKHAHQIIPPVEKQEYYPQSSAQKRLYFLEQFENIGTSYNMTAAYTLTGQIDVQRLELAARQLIHRHESLRTSFLLKDDKPMQQVHPSIDFSLEYYNTYNNDDTAGQNDVDTIHTIIDTFRRPFDLAQAPLFRGALIETGPRQSILLFDMHHIIADGTSGGILADDFVRLYDGETLPPLTIHYKDFAQWQNHLLESGEIKKQEAYWRSVFPSSSHIPVLDLPTDFPRPAVFQFTGHQEPFRVSGPLAAALHQTAADAGATLYMVLSTALYILLHKYTGQEDIVVGSGIMGRAHADLHNIPGMFVNSLPMRTQPQSTNTCRQFLQDVKHTCIEAYENQDLQFEELVDLLNPTRDSSRNPIFDTALVLQNYQWGKKTLPSITAEPYTMEHKTSKFDFTLFVHESPEEIQFNIEYCTALFKQDTIKRLTLHFKNVLKQLTESPDTTIGQLNIMTPEESRQLLDQFNGETVPLPETQTIHGLVERQAKTNPHSIAVTADCLGSLHCFHSPSAPAPNSEESLTHHILPNTSLTYRELDSYAEQIAHYLCAKPGFRSKQPVAILMEPSIERSIALLGILKAGGVYLPIDFSLPEARIKSMIDDAAVQIVVSQKKYIRTLNRLQWDCPTFHTFVLMDSVDVYNETEQQESRLMDRKLWEYIGEKAKDEIEGGGWASSYTGENFSQQEMDEYGDNILEKLKPLLHPNMRVLEIGCASGISMYRIAPHVAFYYGTDLSETIIRKNREKIKTQNISNINLAVLAAHQIHQLEQTGFDLIIINSVIQAFHGHNYLRQVLSKALKLMKNTGYLFVGDVMDRDLREELINDLETFQLAHQDSVNHYKTKTDFSDELFISRSFFNHLPLVLPEIKAIDFSRKIHTIENELTRYRYDTLITVDKINPAPNPSIPSKYQEDLRAVAEHFHREPNDTEMYRGVSGNHPAYIIYTSGTTGIPKGVIVQHRSAVNTLLCRRDAYRLDSRSTALQLFSYAFDGFVTGFFTPLISGSHLICPPVSTLKDITRLSRLIEEAGVTHFISVPALYHALLDSIPESRFPVLRTVTLAGDQVTPQLAALSAQRLPDTEIAIEYGVTEAAVMSTICRHQSPNEPITIGKPIWNTTLLILDKQNHPTPIGIWGELCISGHGVATGYLNRPQLTADKFINQSHPSYPSHYRTGDLARWLPDGSIQFRGRIDHQVKIRGYRIELGEIESRITAHPLVKQAVVIAHRHENGDKYLCAYYTADNDLDRILRQRLEKSMPDYMVPSFFLHLETMPLTPNKKIDRNALPLPQTTLPTHTANISTPRSQTEQALTAIFAEVLDINADTIGTEADFFRIGGHSLKAMALTAKIHRHMGVKLSLADVFNTPTIKGLAQMIQSTATTATTATPAYQAIQKAEKREYYPLSVNQERLWFLHRLNPTGTAYHMHGQATLNHPVEDSHIKQAMDTLIQRHDAFRTAFITVNHQPVQLIRETANLPFTRVDLSHLPPEEMQNQAETAARDIMERPFNLDEAPLCRMLLIKKAPRQFEVVFNMHHIISDGWSIDILLNEFNRLFEAARLGETVTMEPLQLQYRDFALWQNNQLENPETRQHAHNYWKEKIQRSPQGLPLLQLPQDNTGAPNDTSSSGYRFTLDNEIKNKLLHIASESNTGIYTLLFSVLNLTLSRVSGQEEIVTGILGAGRDHHLLQNIVGFFVNTLLTPITVTPETPFPDFLQTVNKTILEMIQFQGYPVERVFEDLKIKFPEIPVLFNMFSMEESTKQQDLQNTTPQHTGKVQDVKFKMVLYLTEYRNGIEIKCHYRSNLFQPQRIQHLMTLFQNLLEAIAHNPNKTIKEHLFKKRKRKLALS